MEKFYNRKIKINKEQNQLRLDQALAKLTNFTRSQIKEKAETYGLTVEEYVRTYKIIDVTSNVLKHNQSKK